MSRNNTQSHLHNPSIPKGRRGKEKECQAEGEKETFNMRDVKSKIMGRRMGVNGFDKLRLRAKKRSKKGGRGRRGDTW